MFAIGNVLDRSAELYRNKVALRYNEKQMTYAELNSEVTRLSSAFVHFGLEKQTSVMLLMWNRLEFIISDLALMRAGLVKVPLNQMVSREDIVYRANHAKVKVVICDESFYPVICELRNELQYVSHVICIAEGEHQPIPAPDYEFRQFIRQFGTGNSPAQREVGDDDIGAIFYSGGTTGRAKGITHTHRSLIAAYCQEIFSFDIRKNEKMLLITPLSHSAGMCVVPGLIQGSEMTVMRSFQAEEVLDTIRKHGITWMHTVPTVIITLLDRLKRSQAAIPSLQTVVYGSAPMAVAKLKEGIELLGPVFIQHYGQSEAPQLLTCLSKQDHLYGLQHKEEILLSCGKATEMSVVKIFDDQDKEAGPNEVGEIVARCPFMMKEYLDNDEKTQETLRDGWLHTGDLAYKDEDGFIYVVDRKNDMIISGGFNVYSITVENALTSHPNIKECAVIGVPDDKWGEAVKAIVSVYEPMGEEEVILYCKGKLANYEVPKSVEIWPELPKTQYNKIDKKAIRGQYWKGRERLVN